MTVLRYLSLFRICSKISPYSDIRSNPWLTNLGSRTFIESFFNENQARFTQVVTGESIYGRDRGKVFENLIDGALHTSIKGHEKSSFSFGMFAKDSHHDTTVLSKIEALIHPSSGIEEEEITYLYQYMGDYMTLLDRLVDNGEVYLYEVGTSLPAMHQNDFCQLFVGHLSQTTADSGRYPLTPMTCGAFFCYS